ncbi:MAG: acyl-CoA/acyl-ACP dehydrogenase, partial [bacterium]|nr:acyl-CoA/acyl-ACP dehydrogenase [bacterium]
MSDALAFPLSDPVGPALPGVEVPGRQVIAELVAPQATEIEASGVRRSTIDALAAAGLLGRPLAPVAAQRELAELLAGSDASTWFCWAQHFTPVRIIEANNPTYVLLPALRTAEVFSAVAFAHVRRPGNPNPAATRVPGGWRLDGTLDWVTSWDITDVVMVMARGTGADSESLVCAFLPAGHSSAQVVGVEPGEPLSLVAMGGTHTRPVRLDGVYVRDESVGAILDRTTWLAADARTSADANPAIFGVTRGALA